MREGGEEKLIKKKVVVTYGFKNVAALTGLHEHFSVLLYTRVHHISTSRCSLADFFHFYFHLVLFSH